MAELLIRLPDALADNVRELDIAVDAVCQRALLDSVSSRAPRAKAGGRSSGPVLTYRTQAVLANARARRSAPTSVDLLQGLAAEGDFAREVLRLLGVDIDTLAEHVAERGRNADGAASLSTVMDRAMDCARDLGDGYVGSEHLLLSLAAAAPTEPVAHGLRDHGIDPANLRLVVTWVAAGFKFARASGGLAVNSG